MDSIEVLQQCTVEGNIVKLPGVQLDRTLYLEVAKKLQLIGGKWKGGRVAGFVFPQDPTGLLEQIAGGETRNLQKEFQCFFTPDSLAQRMAFLAGVRACHSILEPSAGQGAILKAVSQLIPGEAVYCYELMPLNQTFLKKIPEAKILGDDFLQHNEAYQFDRIIANPPFTKNQDIDHIEKMYRCLKPGGRIVTVASNSWTYGSQKKQVAFRRWIEEEVYAEVEGLPGGTFKDSGTNVSSVLLTIDKAA